VDSSRFDPVAQVGGLPHLPATCSFTLAAVPHRGAGAACGLVPVRPGGAHCPGFAFPTPMFVVQPINPARDPNRALAQVRAATPPSPSPCLA
jgi:hypothetical protein